MKFLVEALPSLVGFSYSGSKASRTQMNAGSRGRSEERKLNAECNDCGGTGELHSGGVGSFERTRG